MIIEDIIKLKDDINNWSNTTFGNNDDRIFGIINHLKEEVGELFESVSIYKDNKAPIFYLLAREELADCFMLLLDIASKLNISLKDMVNDTEDKLLINKAASWNVADKDGVCKRIKKRIDE